MGDDHTRMVNLVKKALLAFQDSPLTEAQSILIDQFLQGKTIENAAKDSGYSVIHAKRVSADIGEAIAQEMGELKRINKSSWLPKIRDYLRQQPESDSVEGEGSIAHPSIPNLNFVEGEGAIAANNRGFDCYMNADLTQANKLFELALKINPDNAASYYNQAWSYEQVGDFDRAIELYRQAALHGLAAAYCNLARLHIIEKKNYDLAVDICQRGLTFVQEDTVETDKIVKAALFIYLAWAWIDRGRDEEALERLQEAIELEGDRALTHALMAQALDNLGQNTEALEAWKNYINKYPKCNCRDKDVWMGKARQRLKESS